MSDLFDISREDMAIEAERELRMRRSVYPRQVADGKLKQAIADRRIALMQAIVDTLRAEASR